MGHTSYNTTRATKIAATYASKSRDEIFTQNVKRKIHESMNPSGVRLREARDSEAHPETLPIILALDLTGSMGHIPQHLIKEGLPKLISRLIQRGILHPALMFIGVGDHECDNAPLQIGQFESGDEEMNMWLERTYIESGGGGNDGESYMLPWYFAANHVVTDHLEKRGKRGILITIGDEPCLKSLPLTACKEIMGSAAIGQGNMTRESLAQAAAEKFDLHHIRMQGRGDWGWFESIGKVHALQTRDPDQLPNVLSEIIFEHARNQNMLGLEDGSNMQRESTNEDQPVPEGVVTPGPETDDLEVIL